MFRHEISSRDETGSGMKSSFSRVNCLLLFTRFFLDEILSPDELIPVKKTGMKWDPRIKKRRKKEGKQFILVKKIENGQVFT